MDTTPIKILDLVDGDDGGPRWTSCDGEELKALKAVFNGSGRRVHVITVTGPGRHGSSFLANVLDQCIKANAAGIEGVLGHDWYVPQKPLQGFDWGHGDERMTRGIWITAQPTTLQDEDGQDVDVYLVNTQSVCDQFSSPEETQLVLRLCLQISTTLVFSVPHELSEEKLATLGQAVKSFGDALPCKQLYIAVRDYGHHPQYHHGETGGQMYLDKKLQPGPSMSQHSRNIHQILQQGMNQIYCTLLPAPGANITRLDYKGDFGIINPKFIDYTEELMLSLVSPENLGGRACNRPSLKGPDLVQRVRDILGSPNGAGKDEDEDVDGDQAVPQVQPRRPRTRAEDTNPEQLLQAKCEQCLEEYRQTLETAIDSTKYRFLEPAILRAIHEQAEATALRTLEESNIQAKYGVFRQYASYLKTHIGQHHAELDSQNSCRRDELHTKWNGSVSFCVDSYRTQVQELFGVEAKKKLLVAKIQFETMSIEASVKKHFMTLIDKDDAELVAEHTQKLEGEFQQIFATEKAAYEERRRDWLARKYEQCRADAEDEYYRKMKRLTSQTAETWSEDELDSFHKKTRKHILSDVDLPDDDDGDKLKAKLRKYLDAQFSTIYEQNHVKREEFLASKDKLVAPAVAEHKRRVQELVGKKGQTLGVLERSFAQFKSDAVASFKRNTIINDPAIVLELVRELETQLEVANLQGLQDFEDRLKSDQQRGAELIESAVNRYRLKMEHRSKAKQMPDGGDIDGFHDTSLSETMAEFEDDSKRKGLDIEQYPDLRKQLADEIESLLPELKQKAADFMMERLQEAGHFIKMGIETYKASVQTFKASWRSEADLQAFHNSKAADAIRTFQEHWMITDERQVTPAVDRLLAELVTVYEKELDELKIRIEKDELLIATKTNEASKMYEKEMKTHFAHHPFIKPVDFRLKHEKITGQILTKLGKGLSANGQDRLREALFPLYEKYNEKNNMNTPGEKAAIGIDLGTTHSCVAIYHNGKVEIIESEVGARTVPSYVAITAQGEVVGEAAKQQAHEHPVDTIFDAKRLIGRDFYDECVQADIKLWPFKVDKKPDSQKPIIIANGQPYEPEFISTKILKHLKSLAGKYLKGVPVTRAVITVPAYFNDGQRQATKDAAEIAELEVLQIVNEPTAAAIAYYLHQADAGANSKPANILVYDLGGGTFDVSVLAINGGQIQVLSTAGDAHLGGEDFDHALVQHCVEEFKKTKNIDLEEGRDSNDEAARTKAARQLRRLRNMCELQKKNLSSAHQATISVDGIADGEDLAVSVSRKEFEDMNMARFKKTLEIVEKAIQDAKLGKEQVNEIVLVGGSSRIPRIQSMLSEFFNGRQLNVSVNPDEAVAYGAAILAAKLNGIKEQKLQKMSLHDVTPLSIGIELSDYSFDVLIPRNTPLPFEVTRQEYSTSRDFQTEVVISIFEGEEKVATKNHLLGKFTLSNIPAKRAGKEEIHVTMKVDEEGILSVSASCPSSGSTNDIAIRADKGRLTTEEKRRLRLRDS